MNQQQQQQQLPNLQSNMQMGSGLTRYRSAPSSYFSAFLNENNNSSTGSGFGNDDFEQLFNPRASSPETQRIFSRFMNSSSSNTIQENCASNISQSQPHHSQLLPPRKKEPELQKTPPPPPPPLQRQQSNDYSSVSHMMYQPPPIPQPSSSAMDNSYNRFLNSRQIKMEVGGGGGSGLIRQSSSPAGLLASIDIESEFGGLRGMGNFGGGNAEASSRFKGSGMEFSTSSGMMAPISEIGNKENSGGDGQIFDEDFTMNSWDDSVILSDNFLKGLAENDSKPFLNSNAPDHDQNREGGHNRLSHHLSLPTKPSELEKLFQDSVPCKIRAKRGCATHPRSIAERVRRTKISERMRKLQELVPNMEKQTNTSDMLDLAVDYIKDLQRQVKKLSDNRTKCSCLAKEQS